MSAPASVINQSFIDKVSTETGREKTAAFTGKFIRDRLREVCFIDKVVPPEPVTRADCQVSENHDTLVKIVEIEPRSSAMVVNFRGTSTTRYIRAPRVAVPFYTIMSEKFEKTEQELLAYSMPITKVIEDNSTKDLGEVKDRESIRHVESCVQLMQKNANSDTYTKLNKTTYGSVTKVSVIKGQGALQASADDFVVYPILRPDFVNLFKLLDGRRLRAEVVLMTEVDFDDILSWTLQDTGDKMQSETMVDGYKYNVLLGRKFIRTIKTDILRPGNVYCFTSPEFFAVSYILNNVKFYIDKKVNMISFVSWMDVGLGFINVASVAKLELYAGSVTPTDTDTGFAAAAPVVESDLGKLNNLVDDGKTSGTVTQY